MLILRGGGHKAQDPSTTEGALTAACCQFCTQMEDTAV